LWPIDEAAAEQAQGKLLLGVHGQHQNPQMRAQGAQLGHDLDAAATGQADIQNEQKAMVRAEMRA
jgi:hypothetical protein